MSEKEDGFREFVLADQLGGLEVDCRAMFGGFGLYLDGRFFGIIHKSRLFFKTDSATRKKYLESRSRPFRPNKKQTLKNYYEVPPDIIENPEALKEWAREASGIP